MGPAADRGIGLLTTVLVSVVTALVTGLVTFWIQEQRLKLELRTEFMAEQAVKALLEHKEWKKRSFEEIKKRVAASMTKSFAKVSFQ